MVTDRLLEDIEEIIDVTVHIDPEDDEVAIPCKGLPLRVEAEALLQQQWCNIPNASARQRLVLHYLAGSIDVDVYFPSDFLPGNEGVQELHSALQEAAGVLPEFGQVRIFFGYAPKQGVNQ